MPERVNTAQRRARRAFITDLRVNGCVLCGVRDLVVTELHHVDAKKKDLSDAIYWDDEEAFLTEVAKCVVLCANCHKRVHATDLEAPRAYLIGLPRLRKRWKEFLRTHVVQNGS